MKMILNNGMVIGDAPIMSEKTRQYLRQFWHFPSREEAEKEKEKYYLFDCKREAHRRDDQTEHEIEP
ncbi:MAG: hypothetical protein WCO05_01715 [Candidatus Moraniibacteriota bacterium]|jgi:hypothetical protein